MGFEIVELGNELYIVGKWAAVWAFWFALLDACSALDIVQ